MKPANYACLDCEKAISLITDHAIPGSLCHCTHCQLAEEHLSQCKSRKTKAIISTVRKTDLTPAQLIELDNIPDCTAPCGQFYIVREDGSIAAINNDELGMFLAQGGDSDSIILLHE